MRGVSYKGVEYKSVRECCAVLGISYQKVRRLCRWFVRARDNPAVAVAWTLGDECRQANEPHTDSYADDLCKSTLRVERMKDRLVGKAVDRLSGEIK